MKGEHTYRGDGYNVTFWKGNIAAGRNDEWDRAVYFCPAYPTMTFEITDPKQFFGLCIVFDSVFEAGEKANAKTIRLALGIKE